MIGRYFFFDIMQDSIFLLTDDYQFMEFTYKEKNNFKFIDHGSGHPVILLHGLMGNFNNFEKTIRFFSDSGCYRVLAPSLPLYDYPLLKTNIKTFSKFLHDFISYMNFSQVTLVGNSLGGHISLVYAKRYPQKVHSLVLTGSSGLYENSLGNSFPKRGDYDFIKDKISEIFYNEELVTKELVDDVFEIVNNRNKVIRTLAIAKSAIRHNMSKELGEFRMPACLIWGKNDIVTPPSVAEEFDRLLPFSDLFWIDECGHAPMMEQPDIFNSILFDWLSKFDSLKRP